MGTLSGIFPALLTPFDAQNRIDEAALSALIEMNIRKGVDGFYVGGSTGEAFLLDLDERLALMRIIADITKKRVRLIAHVGCIATHQAVSLAEEAQKREYDAISSIPPFYYGFSKAEILEYYFTLSKHSELPLIVYNYPVASGVSLDADDFSRLLTEPKIAGIKHTSNDFFALERIKSLYPKAIVYNGFDEMFLAGLSMGADGGIGSTYNIMAEKFILIRNLFLQGELHKAMDVQRKANEIISVLIKVGVLPAEKALLNIMGINFGACRKPFQTLTAEHMKMLESIADYLNVD